MPGALPCPNCGCGPVGCEHCDPDFTTPEEFQVVIAGMTNFGCTDCGSYNGTFVLTRHASHALEGTLGCIWSYTLPGPYCTSSLSSLPLDQIILGIKSGVGGGGASTQITVNIVNSGTPLSTETMWSDTETSPLDCSSLASHALSVNSNFTNCVPPATVEVTSL